MSSTLVNKFRALMAMYQLAKTALVAPEQKPLAEPKSTDQCWVSGCEDCQKLRRPCCSYHDLPCHECRAQAKPCSYVYGCSTLADKDCGEPQ